MPRPSSAAKEPPADQPRLVSVPAPPPSKTRARDGLTPAERDRPFADDPALLELEARAAAAAPSQLPLFAPGAGGQLTPFPGGLPPLEPGSSLELARAWYRRELEQGK